MKLTRISDFGNELCGEVHIFPQYVVAIEQRYSGRNQWGSTVTTTHGKFSVSEGPEIVRKMMTEDATK